MFVLRSDKIFQYAGGRTSRADKQIVSTIRCITDLRFCTLGGRHHCRQEDGVWQRGGPQTVIKTRKDTTSFVDVFSTDRRVNIVNSKLKETDGLSDDLWWLLLTVAEHTCLSGRTLSGTVYPQQPTHCATPSCLILAPFDFVCGW